MPSQVNLADLHPQLVRDFLRGPFLAHVAIEDLKLFRFHFLFHARDRRGEQILLPLGFPKRVKIDKLKYDPAIGSFKGWLLQITRWRIVDQFRKREPGNAKAPRSADDRLTATIERVPDSRVADLDAVWEAEWKENLFEGAIARVKRKVDPKQFQIFDCYVRKEWPAQKVAEQLRVSVGQVYLARHRVGAVLKKEIRALEKAGR